MQAKQIIALLSLIMIFTGAAFGINYLSALTKPALKGRSVIIEIAKGDSLKDITAKLNGQKLVINPFWFKLIAFRQQAYKKLKAGEYELTSGITMPEIISLFALGKTKKHTITFPEGWSFQQFFEELQKNPYIEHTLYDKGSPAIKKLLRDVKSPFQHPEGLFFPDTYFFTKHTTDVTVLKMAYDKMQSVLSQEWQGKADGLPLKSPYEALVLASIIEKETGSTEERPQIAGVFIRRLQSDMLLQTDPTVIYGMGEDYHGNISRHDLTALTPYNTYQVKGLPPTPIAMPGRQAIHAALHPDDSSNLYFVARGDGRHVFSATLEAHNLAVNLYQKNQRP